MILLHHNRVALSAPAPPTLADLITANLGVTPQVVASARELAEDDADPVATFGSFTTVGSPTLSASGWATGVPGVVFDGSTQYGAADSEAANYSGAIGAMTYIWVLSLRITTTGLRNFLGLGNSGNPTPIRWWYHNASSNVALVTRSDASSADFDTAASGFQINTPIHIGVVRNSGTNNMWIVERSSGGDVTKINTTHAVTGDITLDRLTLMGSRRDAGPEQLAGGVVSAVSMTRMTSPTLANLQSVLDAHDALYPVN
jgi:hypothetical protein